jgi:hypothetical protein
MLAGGRAVLAELDEVVVDPLGIDQASGDVVDATLLGAGDEPDAVFGEPVEPLEAVDAQVEEQ